MSKIEIQKHADYTRRVSIKVNGAEIDNAEYEYVCKIRENPANTDAGAVIPGGVIVLQAEPVPGDASKVDISLTRAQTATLLSTSGLQNGRLPLLDIKMTHVTTGQVVFTPTQRVIILDTQSHA